MESVRFIPRWDIRCTRCDRVLPMVAAKRRAYMRKYYQRPEVKAKAKRYRDRHRAKPEVKKQRSEQGKAYYQSKKKAKKVSK